MLSSSQLSTLAAFLSSVSALALILLEYFKDQTPIAMNPTNNRPRTMLIKRNEGASLVTILMIPISLRIIRMIPIPPHTKNVMAEDKLSLYLSVLLSYRLPPVRRESFPLLS